MDDRVVAVERVPAPAEIVVLPIRCKEIVDVIVKSLEGKERPLLVALRRVVEDHVQKDLDPLPVEVLDQIFQLIALPVILGGGSVAGVGSEKADGVITPVVIELVAIHFPIVLHLVKLEDGHQLHGVHAQTLKVGQLLPEPRKGPRMEHPGGGILRKAPDMELVDNEVLHGNEGQMGVLPVEVVLYHPRLVVLPPGGGVAPAALPGDSLGVGVQQVLGAVKDEPLLRLIGAVHPVGVLKFLNVQLEHDHGVHIADPVALGEREHRKGLLGPPLEEQQFNGIGPVGVDREIHSSGDSRGPIDLVEPGPHVKPADGIHGHQVDGAGHGKLYHLAASAAVRHLEQFVKQHRFSVPPQGGPAESS